MSSFTANTSPVAKQQPVTAGPFWPEIDVVALREAIRACRNGGTVSIPGVYGGYVDKIPFGAIVNKALVIRTGQTHVQKYLRPLLDLIQQGRIDPSFVISHHLPLEDAPYAYRMFRDKQDECVKVVLKPGAARNRPAPTVAAAGQPLH